MKQRSVTPSGYQLGKSTGTCSSSGAPLEPGMPCIAALCEPDEPEAEGGSLGLVRHDYSVEAWESGARPSRLFSWWRTKVPPPGGPKRLLVDDEALLDLFDRLAEDDDERRRAFRWVLGLILVRKKLLKLEGTAPSEEGTRFMLRRRGSDPELPPVELLDPELSEDDARAIADELGEIMADDDSAA
ncbi:MAG: hypothetical protein VX641_02525 [Planctomycetota bacterium]|nr:hypothetical protein [Planctomycetota bacterium]